jgi:hypothetical protein
MMPQIKRNKFSVIAAFITWAVLTGGLVTACNSGDTGQNRQRFVQTYTAGLSVGDLTKVQIDTDKLTYRIDFVAGDHFKNHPPISGKLTYLPDYKGYGYQLDENENAIGILAQDFALGIIYVDGRTETYIGVPASDATTLVPITQLVGVYNYVRLTPNGALGQRSDTAGGGTFVINADGTWQGVNNANLAKPLDPEAQGRSLKGTLAPSKDNSYYIATIHNSDPQFNGKTFANVVIRPGSADGAKHTVIFDFALQGANTFTPGFEGVGMGTKQGVANPTTLLGNYTAIVYGGGEAVDGTVSGSDSNLSLSLPVKSDIALGLNNPWDGITTGLMPNLDSPNNVLGYQSQLFAFRAANGDVYGLIYPVSRGSSLGEWNLVSGSPYFPIHPFIAFKK